MTAAERRPHARRKPRYGADTAHSWARNIELRNHHAKSVLMMMCFYVDENGVANMGLERLAQDTDLTVNTIRNRLTWLEEVGAITRRSRWLDENGRLNYEGRGKRTSDDITLLIAADQDAIEWEAWGRAEVEGDAGSSDDDAFPETAEVSPPPHGGLNPPSDSVSLSVALQQPSTCVGGLDSSEPEPDESPQRSPCVEPPQDSGSAKEAGEAELTLQRFKATYPIPTNRPERLGQLWENLTPDQRATCQRGAVGARRHREQNAKRPPPLVDPARFVANPQLWAEYARYAPPELPKAVEVDPDSDDWLALRFMRFLSGAPAGPPRMMRAVPAGGEALARLARHVGFPEDHNRLGWNLVPGGSKYFNAWAERIKEWTGQWPEAERIPLDPDGQPVARLEDAADTVIEIGGKRIPGKSRASGLLVPGEWPPPKGSTGPPAQSSAPQDTPASHTRDHGP